VKVWIDSNVIITIPNLIEICLGALELKHVGKQTDSQTQSALYAFI
jgi:hypothetical protein